MHMVAEVKLPGEGGFFRSGFSKRCIHLDSRRPNILIFSDFRDSKGCDEDGYRINLRQVKKNDLKSEIITITFISEESDSSKDEIIQIRHPDNTTLPELVSWLNRQVEINKEYSRAHTMRTATSHMREESKKESSKESLDTTLRLIEEDRKAGVGLSTSEMLLRRLDALHDKPASERLAERLRELSKPTLGGRRKSKSKSKKSTKKTSRKTSKKIKKINS